ncbi:hypothetical protein PPTG_24230 [Phytophthora nicotianae INRA-310]|uniref:Uncharacterized protein n=1 Tax=Phytophthora nicotianae (strain INRA-310) TaxID=761204 RepID=W2PIW7_PHYN3|nr:hypothetical protein PPTG_24230 [Phytophthora nicotianae INRA-310]ETN00586.1 hypothetical protein PPTG_24230 [Phytophthora nicotianae INRA-310]
MASVGRGIISFWDSDSWEASHAVIVLILEEYRLRHRGEVFVVVLGACHFQLLRKVGCIQYS